MTTVEAVKLPKLQKSGRCY